MRKPASRPGFGKQNVITAIETFAAGASRSDDITMLIVRFLGSPAN